MNIDSFEFTQMDAIAQADLVRRGDLPPMALVEAAIERIEQLNPTLNAVITTLYDKARQQVEKGLPDGPFRGVPLLIKDFMCPTEGDPYYAGIGGLRTRKWTAKRDCYLAERLRAAGFVFLGKTNTPELAMMATTEPLAFGATLNPWNIKHSAGGSSGGSAAAVAARMVPAAHATDAAGSIRIPASECGLVGLKPSRGRISLGPESGEALGLMAVQGALTHTMRDAAAILDVMAGAMPGDPCIAPPPHRRFAEEVGVAPGRLRIGLLTTASGGVPTHADCVTAAENAAHLLDELGHDVEIVGHGPLDDPQFREHRRIRACVGAASALDTWSRLTGSPLTSEDVEPATWLLAEEGRLISGVQLADALAGLQLYGRNVARWCEESFDILLSPTITEPPPFLGDLRPESDPTQRTKRVPALTAFTVPFNFSGQPAISLPIHWNSAGLPIGIQLVANYGREDILLRVGSQLETAAPWANRKPEVSA